MHITSGRLNLRKWQNISLNFFLLFAKSKEWCSWKLKGGKKKGKWAGSTAVGEGKLVLERQPSRHARAGCFRLLPMEESLPSTCKRMLQTLHSASLMSTPYIWAENIVSSIFPPSTLNSLEHKSLREGDLPDKGLLSSLEKETWRRMEGIQVALLFPLALIRHFSVSYWALLRGQTHWIHF